jgi:hypothetical protein
MLFDPNDYLGVYYGTHPRNTRLLIEKSRKAAYLRLGIHSRLILFGVIGNKQHLGDSFMHVSNHRTRNFASGT